MNYYRCRYLKKGKEVGREYYFKSPQEFEVGDIVWTENRGKVIIVAIADSEEDKGFIERLEAYKIKSITERVEV